MVGQDCWVNTKMIELEFALFNLSGFGISCFCSNLLPKNGSYQTIPVQQHLYSVDRKRVSYEKWVKTCPFSYSYSWINQVSCDSLV